MQPKTPLFTSGRQHPPRFGHAVYLGDALAQENILFMRNEKIAFRPYYIHVQRMLRMISVVVRAHVCSFVERY